MVWFLILYLAHIDAVIGHEELFGSGGCDQNDGIRLRIHLVKHESGV